MKSYSRSLHLPHVDWNLELSTDCEQMNLNKVKQLAKLSYNWSVCAIGSQSELIQRYDNGEPKDEKLRALGRLFHNEGVGMMADMYEHFTSFPEERVKDFYNGFDGYVYASSNRCRVKALSILRQIEERTNELLTNII